MTENAYIVGIPGSLAAESATRTATRYVLQYADRRTVDTTLLDLREYDLPVYGADRRQASRAESPEDGRSTDVVRSIDDGRSIDDCRSPVPDERADPSTIRETVAAADAVLLGSPMYHGSVSSPLKAALDHCTREEFDDTPVGLLAVAGGRFPRPLLTHLREIALSLDARPLANEVAISRSGSTVEDGRIVDAEVRDRLDALADELVRHAHRGTLPARAGASIEAASEASSKSREESEASSKSREESEASSKSREETSETRETAVDEDAVDGPTASSR